MWETKCRLKFKTRLSGSMRRLISFVLFAGLSGCAATAPAETARAKCDPVFLGWSVRENVHKVIENISDSAIARVYEDALYADFSLETVLDTSAERSACLVVFVRMIDEEKKRVLAHKPHQTGS